MKNQSILFALVVALFASATPVLAKKAKEAPKAEEAKDAQDPYKQTGTKVDLKEDEEVELSDVELGRFQKAKVYTAHKWNNFKTEHPNGAFAAKGLGAVALVSAVAYGIYKLDQKTLNVVDRLKKYFGSAKSSINMDEELAIALQQEEDLKLAQQLNNQK